MLTGVTVEVQGNMMNDLLQLILRAGADQTKQRLKNVLVDILWGFLTISTAYQFFCLTLYGDLGATDVLSKNIRYSFSNWYSATENFDKIPILNWSPCCTDIDCTIWRKNTMIAFWWQLVYFFLRRGKYLNDFRWRQFSLTDAVSNLINVGNKCYRSVVLSISNHKSFGWNDVL